MNVTLFQNNDYVYTEQQRSFITKTATVFLQRKQQRSFYNEQQRESVGTSLFTYIEMALVR